MLKDFIMNIHFSVRRCRCGLLHLLYQKHHLLEFKLVDTFFSYPRRISYRYPIDRWPFDIANSPTIWTHEALKTRLRLTLWFSD